MICPKCGHENDEHAKYCTNCGTKLNQQVDPFVVEAKRKSRQSKYNYVMNIIINIAAFVSLLFIFIGLFGPLYYGYASSYIVYYGGLSWFTSDGWNYLNAGLIATGPFYTTLTLYILNFVITTFAGIMLITTCINNLKEQNATFRGFKWFMLILISNMLFKYLYTAFYYQKFEAGSATSGLYESWGQSVSSFGLSLFTFVLLVYAIGNIVFKYKGAKAAMNIALTIVSCLILTNCNSFCTFLGFRDFSIKETYVFGILNYFESFIGQISPIATSNILAALFAGSIGFICSIFLFYYLFSSIINNQEINAKHTLIAAIIFFIDAFVLLGLAIWFGWSVNTIEGCYNNSFFLTGSLVSIIFDGVLIFAFALANSVIKQPDDNPLIIDQEVNEKFPN